MFRLAIASLGICVAIAAVALAILLWIGVVGGVGWISAFWACNAFAAGTLVERAVAGWDSDEDSEP